MSIKNFIVIPMIILNMVIGISQKQDPVVEHFKIGTTSTPENSEVKLVLSERFQHYNYYPKDTNDHLDKSIYSPKSANFTDDGEKLYVQSLEGYSTSVYNVKTMSLEKVVYHTFKASDAILFNNEDNVFDYKYKYKPSNPNVFKGKPVESCFSHNGRYLWVTYYRRSFDGNAESPSAVAIIDTETDSILRVMPTGPLPKMIAASPDNKFVAVTHWGDNTIGLIDISGPEVKDFKYTEHFIVDYRAKLDFDSNKKVNRDVNCGFCLRGTTFTPDGRYLLVGKMGGGGIAVFDIETKKYLGTVVGMQTNIRHIVIKNGELIIGCNRTGYVQKTNLEAFINNKLEAPGKTTTLKDWHGCYVGYGVRTIEVTNDGKYIFACVNGKNKIVAIRSSDMKIISTIGADSFPVGMAISPDNSKLVVTSQGKAKKGGGNSVMIYNISY